MIKIKPFRLIADDLDQDNYSFFREQYHDRLYEIFPFIQPLGLQSLARIDYKIDYKTENIEQYFKLYRKVLKDYRYLVQKREYPTSIYFNSKSQNINFYDKLEQYLKYCKDNNIIPDDSKIAEYENILRYEVQILRPKIRYMKNEYGLIDCLENYIHSSDKVRYLSEVSSPIFYQGNYYNQYWSRKILQEHYTKNMTNKLIELQKDISIYGVQEVKKEYKQFNTYIKRLEQVGVNPIPIPKNEGITYLHNPLHIAA